MDSELIKIVEKHLLEEVGLPSDKLVVFLKETSAHLKALMDALDEGIDEGEFEIVVSSAHTLKGSLVNLGLDELSKIAGNIETAACNTSPLYLSCYFMRLRKMIVPLLDYADRK